VLPPSCLSPVKPWPSAPRRTTCVWRLVSVKSERECALHDVWTIRTGWTPGQTHHAQLQRFGAKEAIRTTSNCASAWSWNCRIIINTRTFSPIWDSAATPPPLARHSRELHLPTRRRMHVLQAACQRPYGCGRRRAGPSGTAQSHKTPLSRTTSRPNCLLSPNYFSSMTSK